MRGLTILVATADPARFHAALSLAAAQAALGGTARIYLHGEAVALLRGSAENEAAPAAGVPTLSQLREEGTALGVRIIACQTGLTIADLDLQDAGEGVEAGGLLTLLAELGEDRLLAL